MKSNGYHYLTDHVPNYFPANPHIHAKEYALDHSENAYSFKKGLQMYKLGMESSETETERQKNFAHAFRALGETMHLVA
ncbi:MAG TPA: hypothetical protein PLO43_02115, partial [Chlamydiales bacterium]|nr:hypothetical protein [Chlamydiales bacterium]